MNLLDIPFLDVGWNDGTTRRIRVAEIGSVSREGAVDLRAPRADFRGALYQLLIGLLQTALPPKSLRDWEARWLSPPDAAVLEAALAPWRDAFEVDDPVGPAFFQDFDPKFAGETKSVAGLLIESPGDKTIRDNLDHFVQRDTVQAMCPCCAALALLTLQINAPSGGVGHRVSVRGGGPLTTLVLPQDGGSLWQRLWLNVLVPDEVPIPDFSEPWQHRAQVMPWLAPTRTSEGKTGTTYPGDVHPLQAYWSMPRRIRLDYETTRPGACDVCGAEHPALLTQYRTKNYGTNYVGAWLHPLTPYYFDPKALPNVLDPAKPPLSAKGQRGGIGYRHWAGLALGTADDRPKPAAVVVDYNAEKAHTDALDKRPMRLWCFGYDMDNMKARCWYESQLPLYWLSNVDQVAKLQDRLVPLLAAAEEAVRQLNQAVRKAWKSESAEPAVAQAFWQQSERHFYEVLAQLAAPGFDSSPGALAPLYAQWLRSVRSVAVAVFEEWVLSVPPEDLGDLRGPVRALLELEKWLNASKPMRALWKVIDQAGGEPAKQAATAAARSV